MIGTCEVCGINFKYLERHHIQSKSLGGTNGKDNIALICPSDHTLVHRGDLIIEGRFFTSNGDLLMWRKRGEPSITGVSDPEVYLIG